MRRKKLQPPVQNRENNAVANLTGSSKQLKALDAVFGNPLKNTQQVVQARLNHEAFNDDLLGNDSEDNFHQMDPRIHVLIDNYNAAFDNDTGSEQDTQLLIEELDKVEHWIYMWFDHMKSMELGTNHRAMFNLMDNVQEEHKMLIERTVDRGHELWMKDLQPNEREDMNELWTEIITGSGHFKLDRTINDDGVKNLPPQFLKQVQVELFSAFARLMSRPQGRKLLHLYKNGEAQAKDVNFILVSLNEMINNLERGPKKAIAESTVNAEIRSGGPDNISPGTGDFSKILFAPGLKDSRLMDRDKKGNRILSPTFIGYGHELTHTGHFQQGTHLSGKQEWVPEAYGGDIEELITIEHRDSLGEYNDERVKGKKYKPEIDFNDEDTYKDLGVLEENFDVPFSDLLDLNNNVPSEGDIREEHGLSLRYGHNSTTANPLLFPGGMKDIPDSTNWARPLQEALHPQQPNNTNNQQNCFLTTACAEAAGLPDDCEELQVLRAFRDGHLMASEAGTALVRRYYELAPGIVRQVGQRSDATAVWEAVLAVVRDCVADIRNGQNERAVASYTEMVEVLQKHCGPAAGESALQAGDASAAGMP